MNDAPVTGFSHIQLRVTDLEASERWYSQVLGVSRMAAGDGYVALSRKRVTVVLSTASEEAPPGAVGLDHLAFAAADRPSLDAWAASLAEAGIAHAGVDLVPEGASLILTDPDGLSIELIAP